MKYLFTYTALNGELCMNFANIGQLARLIEFAKSMNYNDLHIYEVRKNQVLRRNFSFDRKCRILSVLNEYGIQTDYHMIKEGVRP